MNKTVRFVAILGVFLVIPASLLIVHHEFTAGALKRFKADLRARGEKVTFVELAIPASTNLEEIACRELFASNRITFEGSVPVLMSFVEAGKARVAWRGGLQMSPSAGRTNAGSGSWEGLDRENDAVERALSQFRHVLEHPAPDVGWTYEDNQNGPAINWVRVRTVAQALATVEMGELHRGNFDAARSNLFALAALARLNRNEPSLVNSMIRVSISELGLRATWEALPAPGWDEPMLAELQHDWEQVDLFAALERGFLGERALGSGFMARVRASDGRMFSQLLGGTMSSSQATNQEPPLIYRLRDHLTRMGYKLASVDEDELYMLRTESRAIETVKLLKENRAWPEVRTALSNLVADLGKELGSNRGRRLIASRIAIPNFSRTYEKTAQAETLRRLAVAAIAIQRFRLRYGKAPGSLAALKPEFLAEVPIDPMSGKALGYRLNSDGTFVLYSVGEDGRDDGGSAGLDIWTGADAVWPGVAGK